jgi:hypothetical protein
MGVGLPIERSMIEKSSLQVLYPPGAPFSPSMVEMLDPIATSAEAIAEASKNGGYPAGLVNEQ